MIKHLHRHTYRDVFCPLYSLTYDVNVELMLTPEKSIELQNNIGTNDNYNSSRRRTRKSRRASIAVIVADVAAVVEVVVASSQ